MLKFNARVRYFLGKYNETNTDKYRNEYFSAQPSYWRAILCVRKLRSRLGS